jgi:AcrR family transcriptional regulator
MTIEASKDQPRQQPARRVVLPGSRSPLDPSRALRPNARGMSVEHVREMQRQRLIDAVVQVVAEEGFEQAGVQTICKRAGVAFNTFYRYFTTKEELFLIAFDSGVQVLLEEGSHAYGAAGPGWKDKVQATIRSFLEALAQNPAFARFFVIEAHKVSFASVARVDSAFGMSYLMFAAAQPAVGLSLTSEDLLPLAIGGIYSSVYFYIHSGRTRELPALLPAFTEYVSLLFREPSQAE